MQQVADNKYLKLYKIDSTLIDYQKDRLQSEINFTSENENSFLNLTLV